MYKALIDRDSLIDPRILNDYEIVDTYEEHWPGEDPEVLQISKVKVPKGKVNSFVKVLSLQGLQESWFVLVWDNDRALIILKNKVFTLQNKNPWHEEELSKVIEYGKEHEIDKKYFLNMRNVMDLW